MLPLILDVSPSSFTLVKQLPLHVRSDVTSKNNSSRWGPIFPIGCLWTSGGSFWSVSSILLLSVTFGTLFHTKEHLVFSVIVPYVRSKRAHADLLRRTEFVRSARSRSPLWYLSPLHCLPASATMNGTAPSKISVYNNSLIAEYPRLEILSPIPFNPLHCYVIRNGNRRFRCAACQTQFYSIQFRPSCAVCTGKKYTMLKIKSLH